MIKQFLNTNKILTFFIIISFIILLCSPLLSIEAKTSSSSGLVDMCNHLCSSIEYKFPETIKKENVSRCSLPGHISSCCISMGVQNTSTFNIDVHSEKINISYTEQFNAEDMAYSIFKPPKTNC
jgi:hypothetical protein